MIRPTPTQARPPIDGFQAHAPEQTCHPLVVDLVALSAQAGPHTTDAVVGRSRVLLVEPTHQPQVSLRFAGGTVVVA